MAVDTGDVLAGRRGPLSFQGEVLHAFVDRSLLHFPGLYLAVGYLILQARFRLVI